MLRLCLPNTPIDIERLHLLSRNCCLSTKDLNNLIKDVVFNTFTPAENLDETTLLSIFEAVNWDLDEFIEFVGEKYGISSRFNSNSPGNHISSWNIDRLIDLANKLGYRFVIPQYRGTSVAPPFRNSAVFDTTEPHLSFYVELVK